MGRNNTAPKVENTAPEVENTAPEVENTAPEVEREPLLEFHSPAAALAYAEGKKTMRTMIRERYSGDKSRYICVGNNPPAVLPTEEKVEVVPEEYYALENSMAQRKANKKEKERLQREFQQRAKYLK